MSGWYDDGSEQEKPAHDKVQRGYWIAIREVWPEATSRRREGGDIETRLPRARYVHQRRTMTRVQVPDRQRRLGRNAARYTSLYALHVASQGKGAKLWGIVNGKLYEMWPGGRNIVWGEWAVNEQEGVK